MGTNQMSPQGQNRKFITGTNLSFRRSTLKKKEKKKASLFDRDHPNVPTGIGISDSFDLVGTFSPYQDIKNIHTKRVKK